MWKWNVAREWKRRKKLDKERFFYEKSVYLLNGISLPEALKLSEAPEEGRLRDLLLEGAGLTEAFKALGVFNERELSILRLSEETGTMGKTFRELYEDLREERELSERIRTVLIYPGILFVSAVLFLFFAVYVIIPPLHALVGSMGSRSAVLGLIDAASRHVPYQAGAAIAFLLCFLVIRTFFSRTLVVSLVLGQRKRRYLEHLFIREFSKLLSSGMDIFRALSLLRGQEVRGGGVMRRVEAGADLMTAFREEGFSLILVSYVRMAEETGDLITALEAYSSLQRRYFEDYLKKKAALVEPVAIFLMGLLVLGVAAAVLLPMLDAYEAI